MLNPPDQPTIPILGAGPAGLAAAYALAQSRGAFSARPVVIEAASAVGGNSASFKIENHWCDFGSHRFHPVAEPEVLTMVQDLLGNDLLLRPRHGRIRLGGRWIHFPLKLEDAIRRLPPSFAASLIGDILCKPLRKPDPGPDTFASVLRNGLGPTISENFYFPYVQKLWGLAPEKLAITLAERRVSGSSVSKILSKMIRMLPGLKGETTGKFYYPRNGFGQISTRMAEAAEDQGAAFLMSHRITRVMRDGDRVTGIEAESPDGLTRIDAPTTLSTIPVTTLVRLMDPQAPDEVRAAADAIRFRGMILIYLVLETERFSEYDAHYFPEAAVPISRMSEPRNYSMAPEPRDTTVLCAELPCDPGDTWWSMTDAELGEAMCGWLRSVGLPVRTHVRTTQTRRLSHAYPVYDLDYQTHFDVVDSWVSGLDGLLNFGRQGLFAHDNTHHAFAMALGAIDSLTETGSVDRQAWAARRAVYASHVVED